MKLVFNAPTYNTSKTFAMKVEYKKLWIMLIEKKMSKSQLRKEAKLSPATLTKLNKDE